MGLVGVYYAAVVEIVGNEKMSNGTAILNTIQWLGVFLSGIVFGFCKDHLGWELSFRLMSMFPLISAYLVYTTKKVK